MAEESSSDTNSDSRDNAPILEEMSYQAKPTTPTKARSKPHLGETPYKQQATDEHGYRNGDLLQRRSAILKSVDYSCPVVDIQAFVKYLLPALDNAINIEDIVTSLHGEGKVSPGDNAPMRWADFQTDPGKTGSPEEVVFKPLRDIFDRAALYASASVGRRPTFIFTSLPSRVPRSHKASSTRPDAFLILREPEEAARKQEAMNKKTVPRWWYDFGSTFEFKKKDTDNTREDDISKIIYNLQHMMTLDACRRFAFGMTIEGCNMRLWFCSRATLAVSTEFNFTNSVHLLTEIFMRLAFASLEELGWDPTIQPVSKSETDRQYDIRVGDQIYRTVEVLSESAADALISRATRTWKVKRLGSEEPFILKDIWIEDDRDLEHEIYEAMLHDVETKYGTESKHVVASHLLTPIAHCLVSVNEEEDHTTRVMMRGYEISFESCFRLKVKKPDPRTMEKKKSVGISVASDMVLPQFPGTHKVGSPFPLNARRKRLHARKHYRIVFKEVAITLDAVRKLSDVFTVLRDVAKVLYWIHGCGWTHRDISVGNLYLYHGRGLIGDLEYAKNKSREPHTSHEVRSGTSDFKAVEVIRNMFELRYPENPEDESDEESTRTLRVPFCYIDLHDLESLWWIAVWEMFFNCIDNEIYEDDDAAEKQASDRNGFAHELFPRTDQASSRTLFLRYKRQYEYRMSWIPARLDYVKVSLGKLRLDIIKRHRDLQNKVNNYNSVRVQGGHAKFCEIFESCRTSSMDIVLIPTRVTGLRHQWPSDVVVVEITEESNECREDRPGDKTETDVVETVVQIEDLHLEDAVDA